MLPYTTILVLALAVSNVSPALSAPIPQVREQSLSHRGPKIGAAIGKRAGWGKLLTKIAMGIGIGTASTVAGYAILDKITGPSESAAPSQEVVSAAPTPETSTTPPGATGPVVVPVTSTTPGATGPGAVPVTSTTPGASGPAAAPVTSRAPASAPATNSNSVDPMYTGTHYPTSYTDSSSSSSVSGRSVSNKNRRATSALELLSRTDLEEALKLFKRVLDELD